MGLLNKKSGKVAIAFLSVITGIQFFMCSIIPGGFETKLIYHPLDKEIRNVWIDIDGRLQDTYFFARDGVKLNAWYVKAKDGKPTVIFCHGQGENISLWQNVIKFLTDNGYGAFLLEYRGHGRSEGKPFESGLYMDLEAAVSYLKTYEKVSEGNIVLWGRSLGGAVVTDIASRNDYKAVILESTFTDIRAEALHLTSTGMLEGKSGFWSKFSGFFVRVFPLTQKFNSGKKVHKIKSPLLIGHSLHDVTVPVEMSYKLKSLNPSAKLFISDKGSHHENNWFFHEVLDFLKTLNCKNEVL